MAAAALVELGESLGRHRRLHGLAIGQVGARLLLSDQQVRDLEAGSDRTFHNRGFYLRALRRYAAFCDVPTSSIEAAFADAAADDVQPAGSAEPWTTSAAISSIVALLGRWRSGRDNDSDFTSSTPI